jgi:hypothetical protein
VVSEALGINPAMEKLLELPGTGVINYEPSLTVSLDEECRTQVRVSVENRTNAYQIRTGEFPEEQLSVYVTARQYGSLLPGTTFVETLSKLATLCRDVVDNYVADSVLHPLQRTIATK